jgi:hypothetical protein
MTLTAETGIFRQFRKIGPRKRKKKKCNGWSLEKGNLSWLRDSFFFQASPPLLMERTRCESDGLRPRETAAPAASWVIPRDRASRRVIPRARVLRVPSSDPASESELTPSAVEPSPELGAAPSAAAAAAAAATATGAASSLEKKKKKSN